MALTPEQERALKGILAFHRGLTAAMEGESPDLSTEPRRFTEGYRFARRALGHPAGGLGTHTHDREEP